MKKIAAICLALGMTHLSVQSADYYWDVNGTTTGVGGSGIWTNSPAGMFTTGNSAGTGPVLNAATTTNDTLYFNSPAGTVTMLGATGTNFFSAGTNIFNANYVVTAGTGPTMMTNKLTQIINGGNLTFLLGGQTFQLRGTSGGGVMSSAGTASTLTIDMTNSTSKTSRRINVLNYDISNNVSVNVVGTGSGALMNYIEIGGSSAIRGNITNSSSGDLVLGANSGATLSIYGTVSGNGNLYLSGAGGNGSSGTTKVFTPTLHSGAVYINYASASGTVQFNANNLFPNSSGLTFGFGGAYGATLDLNGFNQNLNSLSSGATAVGLITNTATSTTATVTVNQASSTTFGLPINGNVALVKTNSGNLTLSGINSFTGGSTVTGGTLTASNAAALGSGAVTVGSGGTLAILANITNTVANSGTISVGVGGTLTASTLGTGALNLAGSSGSKATLVGTPVGSQLSLGNLALSGFSTLQIDSSKTISSSGTITVANSGNAINLTGAPLGVGTYNLMTAGTSIDTNSMSAGGLTVSGTGVGGASVVLGGSQTVIGRTTYDFNVQNNAMQLVVGGGAYNMQWSGSTGDWNYTSTSNWQQGGSGPTIAFYAGDNATLASPSTIAVDNLGVTAGTVVVSPSAGDVNLTGGPLTVLTFSKNGGGTVNLGNDLVSQGAIEISEGTLNSSGVVTASSGIKINGGAAVFNGSNSISGGLAVSSGSISLNQSNTISGGVSVTGGSLSVSSTNNVSGGFTVSGGGVASLNVDNCLNMVTGGVNANGGLLLANTTGALGTNVLVMNGGTLGSAVSSLTNPISLLAGGGTVTNDSQLTISGTITGANSKLTKKGTANLVLAGAIGASAGGVQLDIAGGNIIVADPVSASLKYISNSTLSGNLIISNSSINLQASTLSGTGQLQVVGSSFIRGSSSASTNYSTINLQNDAALTFSNSVNLNLIGGLSGTGNVTMVGSGGGVYVTGSAFTGQITNNSSNDLRFYNADVSGISAYQGTGSGNLYFSNSLADRVVGGRISGAGQLRVYGSAATTFTNTQNDFTNVINVNGSVTGTLAKFIGNGTMGAEAATAEISLGNANTLYLDGVISQRSLGVKTGGGKITVAANSSLGNLTNNTTGGMPLIKDGTGNLTFTGLVRDGASTDAPLLSILNGKVVLGATGINASTTQYILVTNTPNQYVGDLEISAGNQLSLQGTNAVIDGGGTIIMSGNDPALQTSSTSANNGAVQTISNNIVLNGSTGSKASLGATTSNSLIVNQVLGTGDLYFGTQAGGGFGTVQLNALLSYTGNVYMNMSTSGVVRFTKPNLLANAGVVMVRPITNSVPGSGILDLNGNNQSVAFLQSLSDNPANSGIIKSSTSATLTINQSVNTTYGGNLVGELNLVKNNSGVLTLVGTNNYTGTTTVNGGSLVIVKSGLTATITPNTIGVTLSNTPSIGDSFQVVPGALLGTYGQPNVSPLGAGQSSSFSASTGVLTITQQAPSGPTFDSLYAAGSENSLGSNGLQNLMNYALGGTGPNSSPAVPVLTSDANGLTLTANIRNNDSALNVVGQYAYSLDGTWYDVPLSATGANSAVTDTTVKSFTQAQESDKPKKFLRLKVTK